jgi:hypothetical protein
MRFRHYWQAFLDRHLDGIADDLEALIWAVGCLWALRVERLIVRAPPIVNCTLFLAGVHVGVNILFAHLAWYGFPRAPLGVESETRRAFVRFVLYLGAVALVALASPGSSRRRTFAACAFPLLGLVAMVAFAFGMEVANAIRLAEYPVEEGVLRGFALGLLIAMPLSVPVALLYRSSAVPVAILSVLPAIAKANASAAHPRSVPHTDVLFWHLGPVLCALAVLALSTYVCDQLQSRPLNERRERR